MWSLGPSLDSSGYQGMSMGGKRMKASTSAALSPGAFRVISALFERRRCISSRRETDREVEVVGVSMAEGVIFPEIFSFEWGIKKVSFCGVMEVTRRHHQHGDSCCGPCGSF